MNDKKLYQQKKQAQLDEWKAEIAILKAKASKASAEVQLEMNKKITGLETKITENKAKLSELGRASEEGWDSIKDGIESAWDTMKSAVRDAASKFKK